MKNNWITLSLVGCLTNVSMVNGEEQQTINNELEEKELEVIDVVATKPKGIVISSKQMVTMPGSIGDPLKSMDALPGVVLATPSSGGPVAQPAIRGSSPHDNQYQSDLLPVGYVFHQDSLSIFHPELLESFELNSAGWGGEFNDAIGGVITTKLRDPSFDEAGLLLDLSMIRSGLLVESPLGQDAAFYFAYRESLVHNFVDDIVEDEDFTFSQPPRNHDYQAKLTWDIDGDSTVRFIMTGAEDKVRQAFKEGASEVARNPDLASGEGYKSKYDNVGVIFSTETSIGMGDFVLNSLSSELDIGEGIAEQSNTKIDELLVKASILSPLSQGKLFWGAEYKNQSIEQYNLSRLQSCNSEFATCLPTSFAPIVEDLTKVDVRFMSAFAEWQLDLNDHWKTQFGAVVSNNDFTDENIIEPRLFAQYKLNGQSSVNFSLGQYHQWFRNYNYLSTVFGNPDLEQSKATIGSIGFDQELADGWQWKVDLYYKQLKDLITANTNAHTNSDNNTPTDLQPQFLNNGEGTAWGAEFMLNKSLTDNWYGWFSLAYAKSERENTLTKEAFDYEFDIPLIANLVGKYQFNNRWHLGFKWTYQSGRRFTQVIGSTPIYADQSNDSNNQQPLFYQPTYGPFNGEQRDAGHRLDVRLDYFTDIAQYPLNLYLDVLNIYGHQKVQEDEWNFDYTESKDDYEFPDEIFLGFGASIRF